jgi:hypothetical protein
MKDKRVIRNQEVEEEHTIQDEHTIQYNTIQYNTIQYNGQKKKDKMTNTNLQKKTKDRPTRTIINTGGEVRFSGRVNSFYSKCGTRRRAISVTYIVMFSGLCVRVVILFA